MIPVTSQVMAIKATHIPFDELAAEKADDGRAIESTRAQIGITSITIAMTRMMIPSSPKISPVTPTPPARLT
jgi:hypothetical protein